MANWSNPTLTSLYTDFVTEVKNRDVDLALGLDPATTSPTNVPTNAIRWNSASFKYQKWDGSTWNDLSTKYIFTAVEVSGATVPVNGMYLSTTNTLNFSTASTASRLTIDGSGNVNIDSGTFYVDAVNNRVGVGTTGPVAGTLIDAYQALYPLINTRCNGNGAAGYGSSTDNQTNLWFFGARKDNIGGAIGTDRFNLLYNTSNLMTVDTSGNLGLGVVPSAWQSIYRAAQFPAGVAIAGRNDGGIEGILSTNAYRDSAGTWRYVNTGVARRYVQESDGHLWYTSTNTPSAGNPISFTQAMTLDASGRLGIGTTSPLATIDITGSGEALRIQSTTASSNYITHKHNSSGDIAYLGAGGGAALGSGTATDYAIRANQGALLFGTNGNNERARIDSSGRLLVGTTSSRQVNASINALQFQIEGTTYQSSSMSLVTNQNAADGSYIVLGKSRGTSLNSSTIVNSGDSLGAIWFCGADGNTMPRSAIIEAFVDATPGASDMPGRLVFSTTADGAASPTERLRINNLGYMQGTVNGLGAGRIPAKQYYRLDSARNGVNQAAAQSVFGVGVTLVGSTVYEFEALYWLQCSNASGSPTMNFLFGGTATLNNIMYSGVGPGSTTVLPPASFYDAAPTSFITNVATASTVSGTLTSAISVVYLIKGTVSVNAGGTFIPQYSFDVAPGNLFTTNAGSYFSIWPLAASGAAVNIGSWA